MPKIGPGQGGGSGGGKLLPPGVYVVAMGPFERKEGPNTEYLNAKFEVCGGRGKGRFFWTNLMLNVEKEGTRKRWEGMLEAVGVREEFELGSRHEGNADEGDRNIRRLLQGKPFVVEVEHEKDGKYENVRIKYALYRSRWTDEHKAIAAEWEARQAQRGSPEDDLGEPAGGDVFDGDFDDDSVPF